MISHDLGLVRYMADRVVVMYLGKIMESGTADQIFAEPYHPYTEALLSAMLTVDPAIESRRVVLEGDVPSAIDPPTGCPFHTRCHRKVRPILPNSNCRSSSAGMTGCIALPVIFLGRTGSRGPGVSRARRIARAVVPLVHPKSSVG